MQSFDYQGEKFRQYVEKNNLTIVEVAKKLGVSRDTVYSWMDKPALKEKQVKNIVEGLGVAKEEIFQPNVKEVTVGDKENCYMVPLKAYGGFLNGYENTIFMDTLNKISFPFVRSTCFAFEVEGYSMVTDYMPGDYVVTTPVESFKELVKGRVYVFQTIDGLILKCFERMDSEFMWLSSLNEEYNPIKPIPLKNVKKVYQKEYKITKN